MTKDPFLSISICRPPLVTPSWPSSLTPIEVTPEGDDVPEDLIRRRFFDGLSNFFTLFVPVPDS